ncbi:hypothetical protein L3X38_027503 [Prunus dulcis]|uniref:Ubiquitin-like protease family profile domain-containing protein n=1 Tax=Prunus dulcis TaxID=3755 RepID=A0AAD4VPX7_PRUDU|nr:hypothetical protein L3X38_027503 [Prunus dulcis]
MLAPLLALCQYVETKLKPANEIITIHMLEEIFGTEHDTWLLCEDVLQFASMVEIGSTVIVVYMRYLFDYLEMENMVNLVGLVDPGQVSSPSRMLSHRSKYLTDRLKNADGDQFYLVPYNPGGHWVLTIVRPAKETVYYMDSLSNRSVDEDMRNIVNTSIKTYNSHIGKQSSRKSPIWKNLQGIPRQPTNVECGYYVMRFMRDIIHDAGLAFEKKCVRWISHGCMRIEDRRHMRDHLYFNGIDQSYKIWIWHGEPWEWTTNASRNVEADEQSRFSFVSEEVGMDDNDLGDIGFDPYEFANVIGDGDQPLYPGSSVLLWTVNDFTAYGNLSDCVVKGYKACPICGNDTPSHNTPPEPLNREEVLHFVEDINYTWGSKNGGSVGENDDDRVCWKKKSKFFDLEYWKYLHVRHVLDVMHIEKNVCDSIIGTLLEIPEKNKDGIAARLDLLKMGVKTDLQPKYGERRMPPGPWNLSRAEKRAVCNSLYGMKVPEGYCSNIKNLISLKDSRLLGLKSHDCHTLMQQLLHVAIHSVLEKPAREHMIHIKTTNPKIRKRTKWLQDKHNSAFIEWLHFKVDNTSGLEVNELGFTLVDLSKIGHRNDQFVMTSQVKQVIYVDDPMHRGWLVVLSMPNREYNDVIGDDVLGDTRIECEPFTRGIPNVDTFDDLVGFGHYKSNIKKHGLKL